MHNYGPLFDASDSTGAGLKSRARQNRNGYRQYEGASYKALARQVPGIQLYGPMRRGDGSRFESTLRDPNWDAYFQALEEAGVTKLADSSVGAARGMWSGAPEYAPTFDPQTQSTSVTRSNQLNAPGIAALDGLSAVTGAKKRKR